MAEVEHPEGLGVSGLSMKTHSCVVLRGDRCPFYFPRSSSIRPVINRRPDGPGGPGVCPSATPRSVWIVTHQRPGLRLGCLPHVIYSIRGGHVKTEGNGFPPCLYCNTSVLLPIRLLRLLSNPTLLDWICFFFAYCMQMLSCVRFLTLV